jgi:Asp-tRNA(Asn)/Glu-tRNA(Gln) amidotransferase A subunit family amidase/CubicO group peptidase (beta-lactamase class C family)
MKITSINSFWQFAGKIVFILSAVFLYSQNMLIAQNKYYDMNGQKIDLIMKDFNLPDAPGAAVLVVKDHKVVFKKGYGLTDLQKHIPVSELTNFRLASVSKQFTAMCIMILKESGKLKYENTLKDIFPDFPEYGKKILIRNLLQHTSGLIDYEDLMPDSVTEQIHDKDVLRMMMSVDSTYFLPGTEYRYSNSGFAILAMIVEKISGKRYADFLRENIFEPLGMDNSVAYEKGISTISDRALGYVTTGNGFKERDQSTTSAVLGDGGIYTSVMDYFKWDDALYSDKLVSRAALDEAFSTGMLQNGKRTNYGFGWMTGSSQSVKFIEHGGSTCGFTNHVIRAPELKLTVLILTNRFGVKELPEYCRNIADLYSDNLFTPQIEIKLPSKQDTLKMIEGYEKLIGLDFTIAKRDSLYSGVKDYLNTYRSMRKIHLDNSVMPSLLFNPLPEGFKFEKGKSGLKLADYDKTELPQNVDDLAFYSIGRLAYLIKHKKISSVELTKFFIERLKKYGPKLECVITLTEDLALKQAKQADEELLKGKYRGVLHGIPFGVKDLLSTKNYKTTWGSVPYKNQLIDEDATVVKKLEDAGAVLVAKLTMGELAWGDVWYGGKTRNPWNVEQGSSGSSAGSASATSAGLVPFAIGTETYGSIVSPSTICGTTGLRPTYGRVSRHGAMALSWSMDKIGAICRSAEDCAIVFNYIHGPDGIDQTLYDAPFLYDQKLDFTKLNIGYLKKDFSKNYNFKKCDSLTLEVLKKLGANLVPIDLPEFPINELSIMLDAEAAAAFDELTRSGLDSLLVRQIINAWPNAFRTARYIPAVEYIYAGRLRNRLIQKVQEMISKVDLYIAPSEEGDNLLLTNLTGHPCVVFPNGFSDKGLPQSITLTGKLFDEALILKVAKKIQDATDFHQKHPVLK